MAENDGQRDSLQRRNDSTPPPPPPPGGLKPRVLHEGYTRDRSNESNKIERR